MVTQSEFYTDQLEHLQSLGLSPDEADAVANMRVNEFKRFT